jgi:2-polyprenyl-3-methyl-5-hydroxy-6-metoxy-1,4-benzoquinol methylase
MHECNYCASELHPMLRFGKRPIVNDLSSQSAETNRQYVVEMTICVRCGLHQLIHEIDPSAFYTDYMTPSNWKYEPHMSKLVNEISKLAKREDAIIDIGCNDGKFLSELKSIGYKNLYGVEPTKNTAETSRDIGFEVTNGYLDKELANTLVQKRGKFDVVVTRQVLEHIKGIRDFLESARILLSDNGFLIIEVPDSELNFTQADYGVWEEHLNYFTRGSLTRILNEMGWKITKWYQSIFSGWCQTIIAIPSTFPQDSEIQVGRASVSSEVEAFVSWVSQFSNFKVNVGKELRDLVGESGSIALFGVGSRSISTLYSLDLMHRISAAYDDSDEKIGKFIPGTGIQIRSSKTIEKDGIELVLLGVNLENEAKVLEKLQRTEIQIRSILPPSEIILWR